MEGTRPSDFKSDDRGSQTLAVVAVPLHFVFYTLLHTACPFFDDREIPMDAQLAKNFTEYITWMASNSPHATLLAWIPTL